MDEVWRDIPGYANYQASSLGRIRSVERRDTIGRLRKVRVLSGGSNGFGYLRVWLIVDGGKYSVSIHKLVMLAFVGPRPPGYDINHIDGDKTNNSPDNLEYCTTSQNIQHSYDNGLQISLKGEQVHTAKLAATDIPVIRALLKEGHRQRDLATQFGVSQSTIHNIGHGKSWTHVP